MKIDLLILLSLLMWGCNSPAGAGEDPANSSTLSIAADYDARTYGYGEPVAVDLAVRELGAAGDYCLLTARCSGGAAAISADGEALPWNERQTIYYDVLGEHSASRKLHCIITPAASAEVVQTLTFEFQVSNAALDAVAVQRIEVCVDNGSPIVVSTQYDKTPFEIGMPLKVELLASKAGYTGDFGATAALMSGEGFFLIGGRRVEAGAPFTLPAGSACALEYQPTAKGIQHIRFTVSDGVRDAVAEVRTEVYNQGGLEEPSNGVYLYAGGVYYSLIRWQDNKPAVKAEGVAVVADGCRFLIALSDVWGNLSGGYTEDLRKVAELPNYTTEAAARGDLDGLQNTRKILAALDAGLLTSATAARQCYYYDPANPGLWYLPAAGQIALIVDNFSEIKQCLREIDYYAAFKSGHCFSSTGKDGSVWTLYVDSYGIAKLLSTGPNYANNCRPVRNL